MTDIENITPAQLAALAAAGWVEAASLPMADGCRILLCRDGGEEKLVNVAEPGVTEMDEYIPAGADIEADHAAVMAVAPLPDVIPLDRFRRLLSQGWRCDPAARYVAGVGYVVTLWIGHAPHAHYQCVAVSTLFPPPSVTEVLS